MADEPDVPFLSALQKPLVEVSCRLPPERRDQQVIGSQIVIKVQLPSGRMVGPHDTDQMLVIELPLFQTVRRIKDRCDRD